MDRSAKDCLVLFDTTVEGRLDEGWNSGVYRQRTKTIKAGPMITVQCYPIWDTATRAQVAKSEARRARHRAAMERLNAKNARKRLINLVNQNFGAGDLILTMEYPIGRQPCDDARARRDMQNLIDRLRRRWRGRSEQAMKYIYVTEKTQSEKYGERWHHHMIITGGVLSREEIEQAWIIRHGGLANARVAQPNERHLSGFAAYLTLDKTGRDPQKDGKNPQTRVGRRWSGSANLTQPTETTADKKISVRKAGQIAEGAASGARIALQKLYPDCELLWIECKRSRWTTGVYITAELRKIPNREKRRKEVNL